MSDEAPTPAELMDVRRTLPATPSPRAAAVAPTPAPQLVERGPEFRREAIFWSVVVAVAGLLLWLFGSILLPFVAGFALAYLLNPLADRMERWGLPRLVAALIVISMFVFGFVLLLLIILPILGGQLGSFIENVPGYVRRVQSLLVNTDIPWLKELLGGEGFSGAEKSVGELVSQGMGWVTTFLKQLWSGGQAVLSLFSLLVVMPVVAFYLVYDWHRMVNTADSWIPLQHRETVRGLAREMDTAIAGFIRGQTAVCLILGSFYALSLALAGLNFGILIGLLSGLITFIPYVGSLTGLILSVGVAVAQFAPDWMMVLLIAGIFFFGQFLEGNFLVPKLVGDSVGVHPVWLMFALFAFGVLFGFVGLLLAVPLAAAISVLLRFALRRYMESPLYTGRGS